MKLKIMCASLLLASSSLHARPMATEAGLGGDISLSAGYTVSTSQFNASDDNAVTQDLNNSGQTVNQVIPLPLFNFHWTTQSLKTRYFIGASRENVAKGQFQFEVGVMHQFKDDSIFEIAYFPNLHFFFDTWADPYVVGQAREETKENAQGLRVAYKSIAGLPLTARLAVARNEIESERSGEFLGLEAVDRAKLDRNADYYQGRLEWMQFLHPRWFMVPSVAYTKAEAKGDANSFDDWGFRLSSIHRLERQTVVVNLQYNTTDFVEGNPVFDNTVQKDSRWSLFGLYTYQNVFNWQDWNLVGLAGYNRSYSNINFMQGEGLLFGLGLAYSF